MGCLMPKKSQTDSQQQQQLNVKNHLNYNNRSYSWSTRDKSQLTKYFIQNEINSIQIRLPSEINGEQFIIENCKNSIICLFDYCNTISIDDCTDCTIFLGPTIGSIVLRNCQDCRLMSASQQFRSRDCKRLHLYLFCATQPAIESCFDLNFYCYAANYNGLQEQFEKANLKIYNNRWFDVYDFSMDNHHQQEEEEKHWTIGSMDHLNEHFCSIPLNQDGLNLQFNPLTSLVPKTEGITFLDDLKLETNPMISNQNHGKKFGLVTVYNYNPSLESSSSVHKFSIESQVTKILQEIQMNIKGLVLLITKYIDQQLSIQNILIQLIDNKMEMMFTAENQTNLLPNQMIVLVFKGNFFVEKINQICQRILSSNDSIQQSKIRFKILSTENTQKIENFNECLSLTFESSF